MLQHTYHTSGKQKCVLEKNMERNALYVCLLSEMIVIIYWIARYLNLIFKHP